MNLSIVSFFYFIKVFQVSLPWLVKNQSGQYLFSRATIAIHTHTKQFNFVVATTPSSKYLQINIEL